VVLNTKHFGCIEVNEDEIICFPEGIPGFENAKNFILLEKIQEEESPFIWLQGIEEIKLAFALVDPRMVKSDYVVDVDEGDVEMLDIMDESKVLIYSVVVVPEDISRMTANLKAPILINTENKKGKQVVLEKGDYPVRYCILEELQRMGGAK
jgi:flagellar assembly factor FliW